MSSLSLASSFSLSSCFFVCRRFSFLFLSPFFLYLFVLASLLFHKIFVNVVYINKRWLYNNVFRNSNLFRCVLGHMKSLWCQDKGDKCTHIGLSTSWSLGYHCVYCHFCHEWVRRLPQNTIEANGEVAQNNSQRVLYRQLEKDVEENAKM